VTYKVCPRCGVEKGRSEFYSNKRTCDGLSVRCSVCMIAAGAKYRKENREKDIARHAKYRKENAEKIKASAADYYKKNREKELLRASHVKQNLGLSSIKDVPQELIELKRLHLQMKHLIKQQGN
jgi:hypothetical protein